MSQLVFEIVSPAPGDEVGRSVNFVVSAHDPDPGHFPKYHVDTVTVQLSAGGPARRASRDGSTWKATMTVPLRTVGGAELQVHGDRQRIGERGQRPRRRRADHRPVRRAA